MCYNWQEEEQVGFTWFSGSRQIEYDVEWSYEQDIKERADSICSPIHDESSEKTEDVEVDNGIKDVIDKYSDVFAQPKSLPSTRAIDHSLPLKPGSMPLSLRPYSTTIIRRMNWKYR